MLFMASLAAGGWVNALAQESQLPEAARVESELQIKRLIEDLDSDDYEVRESASAALRRLGPAALEQLEAAARHPSEEVRFRAGAVLHQIRVGPYRDALETFCAQPDATMDVEQGMWLIARILNPKVRRDDLTKQLDGIAQQVRDKLGKEVEPSKADPEKVVTALRVVLFEDLRFQGNAEDYGNPDNSSLERVLATRKGLPITLSWVTVLVARRLEVPVVGLPVSGPYIVKYDGSRGPEGFPKKDIFFHPYEGGRVLSREDRIKSYPGNDPDVMVPAGSNRETLIRILTNLSSALDHKPDRNDQLQQVVEFLEKLQTNQPAAVLEAEPLPARIRLPLRIRLVE